MALDIKPLALADPDAVEALIDLSFGTDRHTRTAYKLRHGTRAIADLSFGAFECDLLFGTIQCWPVALTTPAGQATPLILVGPVAVTPERQGMGLGKALMDVMLAAADRSTEPGADALTMIGDPEYYGRFWGFSADATQGWRVPGPVERHRLLVRTTRALPTDAALGPRVEVAA